MRIGWRHRSRVRIRLLSRDEDTTLDTVFAGLSPESRARRYLDATDRLTDTMRRALVEVDGDRHVAIVAEARVGRRRRPVGLGRYVVEADGSAEIAYEVVDAWHGHGIGTRLVHDLASRARSAGLHTLRAYVTHGNTASLGLLRRVLPDQRIRDAGNVLEVECRLVPEPFTLDDALADLGVVAVTAA